MQSVMPRTVIKEFPEIFQDPVKLEDFTDPVRCPHGHILEYGTLLEKGDSSGNIFWQCPLTGEYFPNNEFKRDNFSKEVLFLTRKIYDEMVTYRERNEFLQNDNEKLRNTVIDLTNALKEERVERQREREEIAKEREESAKALNLSREYIVSLEKISFVFSH